MGSDKQIDQSTDKLEQNIEQQERFEKLLANDDITLNTIKVLFRDDFKKNISKFDFTPIIKALEVRSKTVGQTEKEKNKIQLITDLIPKYQEFQVQARKVESLFKTLVLALPRICWWVMKLAVRAAVKIAIILVKVVCKLLEQFQALIAKGEEKLVVNTKDGKLLKFTKYLTAVVLAITRGLSGLARASLKLGVQKPLEGIDKGITTKKGFQGSFFKVVDKLVKLDALNLNDEKDYLKAKASLEKKLAEAEKSRDYTKILEAKANLENFGLIVKVLKGNIDKAKKEQAEAEAEVKLDEQIKQSSDPKKAPSQEQLEQLNKAVKDAEEALKEFYAHPENQTDELKAELDKEQKTLRWYQKEDGFIQVASRELQNINAKDKNTIWTSDVTRLNRNQQKSQQRSIN